MKTITSKLSFIVLITILITSCAIITNKHRFEKQNNTEWKIFSTSPHFRYFLTDNNYIGVSAPMLYEEVVAIGPLVFPIIPLFYHDQYVLKPYKIHISTSWKKPSNNITNKTQINVNSTTYVYSVIKENEMEYISINMPSSSINSINIVIPSFKYQGKELYIPPLDIISKSKHEFTSGL